MRVGPRFAPVRAPEVAPHSCPSDPAGSSTRTRCRHPGSSGRPHPHAGSERPPGGAPSPGTSSSRSFHPPGPILSAAHLSPLGWAPRIPSKLRSLPRPSAAWVSGRPLGISPHPRGLPLPACEGHLRSALLLPSSAGSCQDMSPVTLLPPPEAVDTPNSRSPPPHPHLPPPGKPCPNPELSWTPPLPGGPSPPALSLYPGVGGSDGPWWVISGGSFPATFLALVSTSLH